MYIMDLPKYNFIDKLKDLPFVEKIYLFGSRARGDNMPRADIDLAIFCPSADSKEWVYEIGDIIDNADTLLPIDCVNFDNVSKEMQQNILKDGVVLYDRRKDNT